MRALAGIGGALLVALMLSEFFVTFLLPRRVRRDPRIARGLSRSLWRPWRAIARRLKPAAADTFLGFFGPLALIVPLLVWTLGLIIGFGLLEWAVAGGAFSTAFFTSSGLFLSAGAAEGSTWLHVLELLEAATGVGVLFIVDRLPAADLQRVLATRDCRRAAPPRVRAECPGPGPVPGARSPRLALVHFLKLL
jgi:hypothetical protein